MNISTALTGLWSLILFYVVLGNVIYFAKVLPRLSESPKWGKGQLEQIDRYVELLSSQDHYPWFYWPLKRTRAIAGVLLALLFVVGFVVRLEMK